MALSSIRKRSIRSDLDNAAGDNIHLLNRKRGGASISSFQEENRLNVEMAERQTVIGSNENRYFGGLIGNKEIFVMTLIGIALYLIEGEYAQGVCTALTSVPPAVFSYRVLMNAKSTKEGYHSILFYWTVYGLLVVLDQFIGSTHGYNLIKGGLLGAVFLHAIRSNPSAIPYDFQLADQATGGMLTSIFTRYDSQGFMKNTESSGFEARSPTITHFSDDDDSEYMLDRDDPIDVSTAHSFLPSLAMQTTQKVSPQYVYKTATPKTATLGSETMTPPSTIRMHPQKQFETMSALTMTCATSGDLVTVPWDKIEFSENQKESIIQVTNISPVHVMFALKTNADTNLIAAPTTGVLFSGQSIKIRVGVTFDQMDPDAGKSIDKLAIDYALIPQHLGIQKFSPQFFQSQNRRRRAIRVFYQ